MTDRELMQQALEALEVVIYRIERDLEHDHEWAVVERELASEAITALHERLAQPEQTVSMDEYKRLQDLVTSQGIRLMEYESAQPEQEPVKFKCTVIDDANPNGVPLSQWECQSEQEPFCYHDGRNIVGKEFADHSDVFPLYTAPPPRQWQGLTEEDLFDIAIVNFGEPDLQLFIEMGKLVQEELKEKNT